MVENFVWQMKTADIVEVHSEDICCFLFCVIKLLHVLSDCIVKVQFTVFI